MRRGGGVYIQGEGGGGEDLAVPVAVAVAAVTVAVVVNGQLMGGVARGRSCCSADDAEGDWE